MFLCGTYFAYCLFESITQGELMNGHCHSYDINPNLSYAGWLVSVGNEQLTHLHYTVSEDLFFVEELMLSLELWKSLGSIHPLLIHHPKANLHRPYFTKDERDILYRHLQHFLGFTLPPRFKRCIHLFLLKHQNSPDFHVRWSNFVTQILECAELPPELISTHILLLEWGSSK